MSINFGRETCSNFNAAENWEWLVTNGIGGYASGTVTGLLTRRHHGLLIAAFMTPRGCVAQAWTVAEVLRAWLALEQSAEKILVTEERA